MGRRFTLAIVTSLLLCAPGSLNAQIGSLDEAIQAANANVEPEYIQPLMSELGKGFAHFVNKKRLLSPRDRCALALAMLKIASYQRATLEATARVAWQPVDEPRAWTKQEFRNHRHALDLATTIANRMGWGQAQHELFKMAANIAGVEMAQKMVLAYLGRPSLVQFAAQAAIDAVKLGAPQGASVLVAYRIAEWRVLNFIFQNAEAILDAAFEEALELLPENGVYAAFLNEDTWTTFCAHQLWSAPQSSSLFLRYLLKALHTSMFGGPQIYQFQLGRWDVASEVYPAPLDIVRYISIWASFKLHQNGHWSL